jgi:hypothetical protein
MSRLFLGTICVIVLTAAAVRSQDLDRSQKALQVKKAVEQIAASKKPEASIVLNSLDERKGKIIEVEPESFKLRVNIKGTGWMTVVGPKSRTIIIKYRDVLQIEGKNSLVSFVPNPQRTPYSLWDEIKEVGPGAILQVISKEGKSTYGVFFKLGDDQLSLIRGNKETIISKQEIARVYLVSRAIEGLSSKILGGAENGAKWTDALLPISDPSARANPLGIALGVGVGVGVSALIYLFLPKKRKANRLLVFAQ